MSFRYFLKVWKYTSPSLLEDYVPADGGAGLSELESADLCVSSVFLLCTWDFLFMMPDLNQVSLVSEE